MKKFLALTLALVMLCSVLASCGGKPSTETSTEPSTSRETLAAPQNVRISESGLITWDAVEHATSYTVTIGSTVKTVTETSYQVTNLDVDFRYSVVANAENYQSSASSAEGVYIAKRTPPDDEAKYQVAISKSSASLRSGHSIQLTATVTGCDDQTVLWSIEEGEEYATIDPISGLLTAKSEMTGAPVVKVVATSLQDEKSKGSIVLTVETKPELTQAMLDELASFTSIGFDGYVGISLYNFGVYDDLVKTTSITLKTAMNGTNWYAKYTNGTTGVEGDLFYRNCDGIANQVGVSFLNDEEYFPMLADDGTPVSWKDSGLYNNFVGLKVSDFRFNEETWQYEYVGSDETLAKRMVASANPYDFVPTNFALIINEGEIMGIYSKSEPDYTVVSGYKAIMELITYVNHGETVEVPTIGKYPHDDIHDPLNEAIANMRALTSYTLDFTQIVATRYTQGYATSGFVETVTPDNCFFNPFTSSYDVSGNEVRSFSGAPYAYHLVENGFYNTLNWNAATEQYDATRAYRADFAEAKPSFAFAGEIFNKYTRNDDGSITYYVDTVMCPVASTFYHGVGNDIQLYGMFATEGRISADTTFTPYVRVQDGYITEACFYFYIGEIYGVVEIKYSDFNSAELPVSVEEQLGATPARQLPTAWEQLTIQVTGDFSSTGKEEEQNALTYLTTLFGSEELARKVPFLGNVLGDTYGFGMSTTHLIAGESSPHSAVVFYYDVPLDADYTIDSSLMKITVYLTSLGFEADANGVYHKDGIAVQPVDSDLDLTVYVWKTAV